jgi:simple sugar transport system ATP-binding protein
VLKNVNFTLRRGEILGLVGENGAGKSTLMKILFGMTEIVQTGGYDGDVLMEGAKISLKNPFEALACGIGMVHQEFSLVPGFTSTENILLNTEISKRSVLFHAVGKRLQTLDRTAMRKRAQQAIDKLGVNLSPDALVSELPVGHKQFIEIAREISRENVRLLVFDEPTAVLTESEAQIFLTALRHLAQTGIAIIFISHRLQEILDVCDKVAVLRDGEMVAERPIAEVSLKEMALLMVGRDVAAHDRGAAPRAGDDRGEPVLRVKNLWVDMPGEYVRDVSFEVHRGEIFGIGGLAGQGKLGIPNGIMGLMPAGGEVSFEGKPLVFGKPAAPLSEGLAFVSEDRRGVGLLLDEPIDWNITFSAMQVQGKYLKRFLGGLVQVRDDRAMRESARRYIDQLEIRCTGTNQLTRQLSGGNQQKVCLAKAFALEPRLLFVSEPTRGIDVGAKALVLAALRRFSEENGTTVVIVSSELEELRAVCGRIAIISEGAVAGILPYDANALDFGLLMSGNPRGEEGV